MSAKAMLSRERSRWKGYTESAKSLPYSHDASMKGKEFDVAGDPEGKGRFMGNEIKVRI